MRSASRQRKISVQQVSGVVDHAGAPRRVVARASFAAVGFGDHVRSIKSVVKTPPAGVGGVQGIAGVVDGHDQLRPGDTGDFRVDAARGHKHVIGFVHEIADGAQEGCLFGRLFVCLFGLPPGFFLDFFLFGCLFGFFLRFFPGFFLDFFLLVRAGVGCL